MQYPTPWMPPVRPPSPADVTPKSAPRALRRRRQNEYDSSVSERGSMGMKPQQVVVKAGGDIDTIFEGKNAWDSVVRTFVPRLLDISVVNWESHRPESLKKLQDALDGEFEYVGHPLSMLRFRNAIKRFLKAERGRLKSKFLAGQTECPVYVQLDQWKRLKKYWATENQVAKAARMATARKQVKNFSSVDRKGKAGKEAVLVSYSPLRDCAYIM
jgi:hypothetical protein